MSRLAQTPLPAKDRTGGDLIITAGIGDGRGHQGVDWGTSDGIEVGTLEYPVVAGTVVRVANDGPYNPATGKHTAGLNLWLLGDDGTRWKYFHTNKVLVAEGTHVDLATPIAEVGRSGTIAAHLHLEEHAGSWSNPINFEADAREALKAGRFPGRVAPVTPPLPTPAPAPPGGSMKAKVVEGAVQKRDATPERPEGSVANWVVWFVDVGDDEVPYQKAWVPDENALELWTKDYHLEPAGRDDRVVAYTPLIGS